MSRSCWSDDHTGLSSCTGNTLWEHTACIICMNASRVKLTPRRFSRSICVVTGSDALNSSGAGLFKQKSCSGGGMGRKLV